MIERIQHNSITTGICSVVISGTFSVTAIITTLLLVRTVATHDTRTLVPLLLSGCAFVYILVIYVLARRNYYSAVTYLLVLFYVITAGGIIWVWGINIPIGLLIFALAIILAGILMTARGALLVALLSSLILVCIQTAISLNWYTPDMSWTINGSSFGDVFTYATLFMLMALISWLYNHEMERSLGKAKQAEAALLKQKAMLKVQVEERTLELRQLQLEELQHMYHFAELGKRGVILLHDLANSVTALTLEIDDLENKNRSESLDRARQITHYLDTIVDSARERLDGKTQRVAFDIARLITETVDFSHNKAVKGNVVIDWQPPEGDWRYTGDPDSLGQIVAIIISNAIDAYDQFSTPGIQRVSIVLQREEPNIVIRISDEGKGITKTARKDLFKPHHSTKESGLGIGLYITKQIIELQFAGTVALDPRTDRTEFVITLPAEREN